MGRVFAWTVIGLGSASIAWIGLSLAFGGKGGGSMPPSRLEAQRERARQRAQRRAA